MTDPDHGGADAESFDELLGSLAPHVPSRQRTTIAVLVAVLRAGRQLEAWLADTLAEDDLDITGYIALSALWLGGPPHRLSAGELADRIVQTTGGTTKTIRRLEQRELVTRVADPADGRRALIELTPAGLDLARATLDLVLDAFDLDIGELDAAERTELGHRAARLSQELGERLRRR